MVRDLSPIPAPAPGIYPSVDETEYHRWEALSSHRLIDIADGKTPARLRYEMDHPKPSTDTKDKGTMIHAALLQPHRLSEIALVGPSQNKQSKADKAAWAKMEEENPGKVILRPAAWEQALRQVKVARNHVKFNSLLEMEGESELGIVAPDPDTGVPWKALIDRWIPGINTIMDVKTTAATTIEEFRKQVEFYGYYKQAPHYIDTAILAGLNPLHYVIAALETEPPYFVQMYELTSDYIEMGRLEISGARRVLCECFKNDEWPGYSERIEMLEPSHWLARKHSDALGG